MRSIIDTRAMPGSRSVAAFAASGRARAASDRCTPQDREFLRRPRSSAAISHRSHRGGSSASIDAHAATLQRLRDLQLLDFRPGVAPRLRVRHALTRDVVYGDMLPAQTRPLAPHDLPRRIERRSDAGAFPEMARAQFLGSRRAESGGAVCEAAGDTAPRFGARLRRRPVWFERAAVAFGRPRGPTRTGAREGPATSCCGAIRLSARSTSTAALWMR